MAHAHTPANKGDANFRLSPSSPDGAGRAPSGPSSVTSEVILPTGPENYPVAATELLRAEAGDVRAQTVSMERAGAEHVSAERVVMINSGARTIDAKSAQVDRSGVLAV